MTRSAVGIDVGTSTAKLIRGEVKGTSFVVSEFALVKNPDATTAGGWQALQNVVRPKRARVGLTGRDINVRYTRVPRLPDWQLRRLMSFEAQEVGDQSESTVASDFNVLPEIPEIEGEDVVLLSMARESLLEEHVDGLSGLGGSLDAFTPNAIALYNAFLHYGVVMEDTVLVANVGRENIDVILVRGTDLLFARNLTGGSKLFDDALAQRFDIDAAYAEQYKIEEGKLDTGDGFRDANQEKAAHTMLAPAGQILSLLQSAVLFAKNQIKLTSLSVDRVFLCGGGAELPGLTGYLSDAMGVPVEVFDPFVVIDTSKLDSASAAQLEAHRLEAVVALGLATTASDPDSYSIEILPQALRKRREFLGGPAFLIAAAVLALLYLGVDVWKSQQRLGRLEDEARVLTSQFRRAENNDRQTSALLDENEELESYAQELFALKGSGEQLVRTLETMERSLPQDFWLQMLTLSYGSDTELGVEKSDERPILRLSGRAREGTDTPTQQFEEFVATLRAELPEARVKDRMGQSDFTLDLTLLAPSPVELEESEEAER